MWILYWLAGDEVGGWRQVKKSKWTKKGWWAAHLATANVCASYWDLCQLSPSNITKMGDESHYAISTPLSINFTHLKQYLRILYFFFQFKLYICE